MKHLLVISLVMFLLSACGLSNSLKITPDMTPVPDSSPVLSSDESLPGNLSDVHFSQDNQEYTIRQLLPHDGILPIYEPKFVTADKSDYSDAELVMGVEINGDARAYAVGILRSREMVNDIVGGAPILVTW